MQPLHKFLEKAFIWIDVQARLLIIREDKFRKLTDTTILERLLINCDKLTHAWKIALLPLTKIDYYCFWIQLWLGWTTLHCRSFWAPPQQPQGARDSHAQRGPQLSRQPLLRLRAVGYIWHHQALLRATKLDFAPKRRFIISVWPPPTKLNCQNDAQWTLYT